MHLSPLQSIRAINEGTVGIWEDFLDIVTVMANKHCSGIMEAMLVELAQGTDNSNGNDV